MTIDLRSDTITRPDEAMRRAMAAAEVGDDVLGEDPTVRMLEEEAAEAVGFEAALFVPSGIMGNQIALHLHGRPGGEVICEARAHMVGLEMGSMAALSGLMPRPVAGSIAARGSINCSRSPRSMGFRCISTGRGFSTPRWRWESRCRFSRPDSTA